MLNGMFSGVLPPRLAGKGAIFAAMPFMSNSLHFVLGFALLMTLGSYASSQKDAMPFRLDVALEPSAKGEWNLILDLDMDPGDWVVSSYSTDSMFGKVALRFQEPEALTLLGAMEEIPSSQWEVEPFSQLDIRVLRRDKRMIQRIFMDSNHVDDIHGKVFFVLEPLCTPFETTFTLIHTLEGGWQVVHTGSHDAFPPGHKLRG